MNNTAILIFACDRYKLLYQGFDYFFKKHWDHSSPIRKYFATEELEVELNGYEFIKSGHGAWSNRLKKVLAQIEEQYIIFFQEDMWLYASAKKEVLSQVISYMKEQDLKLLKLHSSEVYETQATKVDFDGLVLSKVRKRESNYLMSHQVSIWNKSFLMEQMKDNENPWRNERRGTKRLRKSATDIYQIDLLSENGKPPNHSNDVRQYGGYYTVSENACLLNRSQIFIDELCHVNPEYARKLQEHLDLQITHDGLPKPRKIDPFKRIKNWVMEKVM